MGKTRRKNPVRRDSGQHVIKTQKEVVREQRLDELEEEEEVPVDEVEDTGWFFEEKEEEDTDEDK